MLVHLWDTFSSRWLIEGDLVCTTGLRVGAGGDSALPTVTDLPVITTPAGVPYIPGSSLRGVLRSHVERIVRTLEAPPSGGKGACDPLDEKNWCLTKDSLDVLRKEMGSANRRVREKNVQEQSSGEAWLARQIWERSCRICRVFGSPWLASRVRISDLLSLGPAVPELRDGAAIDRESETAAAGRKYDFEVLPAGTRFRLELVCENLADTERGLLWLGLMELARGGILVGGFKGRGLGRVNLENLRLRFVNSQDRAALRMYLLKGKMADLAQSEADGWLEQLWQQLDGAATALG